MDKHVCTESARIKRIENFLDGNGRAGLNDRVSRMDEKIDHLTGSVSGMKTLLRWFIGVSITIFLALITTTIL